MKSLAHRIAALAALMLLMTGCGSDDPDSQSARTLGPEGLGTVSLGDALDELPADATTLDMAYCHEYEVPSLGIAGFVSPVLGVADIRDLDGTATTPEGIGSGSTMTEVLNTYPDLRPRGASE